MGMSKEERNKILQEEHGYTDKQIEAVRALDTALEMLVASDVQFATATALDTPEGSITIQGAQGSAEGVMRLRFTAMKHFAEGIHEIVEEVVGGVKQKISGGGDNLRDLLLSVLNSDDGPGVTSVGDGRQLMRKDLDALFQERYPGGPQKDDNSEEPSAEG